MNSVTDKNKFLSWRLGVIILLLGVLFFLIHWRVFVPGNLKPYYEIEGGVEFRAMATDDTSAPVKDLTLIIDLPDTGKIVSKRVKRTDEKGLAVFYLRPGKYELSVSDSYFPHDLIYEPQIFQIEAVKGGTNEQKIILKKQ